MNARALHSPTGQGGWERWAASAIVIGAAHLGLIAAAVAWYQHAAPQGTAIPAILVDLAPAASSPAAQPQDLAPGPQMQESSPAAAEPDPSPRIVQQSEPVPVEPKPAAELPPQRLTPPAPPKPEPAKMVPEHVKPVAAKPKRVPKEAEQHSEQPPAPRTSAAPKAERRAALAASASAGAASAAALPSYRDRVAAHLQRFKQYPAAAKSAGEQGTAMLSFTVGRSGNVLASRLAGSSGHSALDAETLAMIRRAQPLPSFPPELTQSSLSFTVPVRFSLR